MGLLWKASAEELGGRSALATGLRTGHRDWRLDGSLRYTRHRRHSQRSHAIEPETAADRPRFARQVIQSPVAARLARIGHHSGIIRRGPALRRARVGRLSAVLAMIMHHEPAALGPDHL